MESTTSAPECASPAITKADQMAWEAPTLRPVAIPHDGRPMELFSECPDWCDQKGNGHDAFMASAWPREHQSPSLKLRTETQYPYDHADDDTDELSSIWGHLDLSLVQNQRNSVPRVRIDQYYGNKKGGQQSTYVTHLFPDEVRELIAVLQHLLKVGQEVAETPLPRDE